MENPTINEMLAKYNKYETEAKRKEYAKTFFYDWFCLDSSLQNKSKNLMGKVKRIANSKKFDSDKCYVFFKNNCPFGPLYDDFRICDKETGDVIFCVTPNRRYEDGIVVSDVWGAENNFSGPLFESTSWKDVVAWFNS